MKRKNGQYLMREVLLGLREFFIPLFTGLVVTFGLGACKDRADKSDDKASQAERREKEKPLLGEWEIETTDDSLANVMMLEYLDIVMEFKAEGDFEICYTNEYSDQYCFSGDWELEDGRIDAEWDIDDMEAGIEVELNKVTDSTLHGEITLLSDGMEEAKGPVEFFRVD